MQRLMKLADKQQIKQKLESAEGKISGQGDLENKLREANSEISTDNLLIAKLKKDLQDEKAKALGNPGSNKKFFLLSDFSLYNLGYQNLIDCSH